MIKKESDIVVVAAGISGLAAAIAAAEKGAKVVVLEKTGSTDGKKRIACTTCSDALHIRY